ncbi:hypothetical protein NPN18_24500, partial [Vibrio parahaemolyticus]|nr:hypothetical protein [Vibrio parahaemolyticus]
MLPNKIDNLRIDLEEIAPGEFVIFAHFQSRKIASLYLKGDRQYAIDCLELARRRILLTVTGEDVGDL